VVEIPPRPSNTRPSGVSAALAAASRAQESVSRAAEVASRIPTISSGSKSTSLSKPADLKLKVAVHRVPKPPPWPQTPAYSGEETQAEKVGILQQRADQFAEWTENVDTWRDSVDDWRTELKEFVDKMEKWMKKVDKWTEMQDARMEKDS
jgi:hypothetical protein